MEYDFAEGAGLGSACLTSNSVEELPRKTLDLGRELKAEERAC